MPDRNVPQERRFRPARRLGGGVAKVRRRRPAALACVAPSVPLHALTAHARSPIHPRRLPRHAGAGVAAREARALSTRVAAAAAGGDEPVAAAYPYGPKVRWGRWRRGSDGLGMS